MLQSSSFFLLFDGPTLILARTAWSRGPTPNLKDLLKPSEANRRGYLEKCRFKVMPEGVPFGASETCKTSGKGKKPQAAKTRRNRKEHAVTIQVKAQTLRPQTSEASSQNMSIQRSVTRCIRNNFRHLSASQCGADTSAECGLNPAQASSCCHFSGRRHKQSNRIS